MSIIETSSEVHPSSSPSLNTKSKLQTCGYETAGGSGVEGGEWVASHSVGGKKQMARMCPDSTQIATLSPNPSPALWEQVLLLL